MKKTNEGTWVPLQYNHFGNPITGELVRSTDHIPAEEAWPETVRWIREALDVSARELGKIVGTEDRQVRRWMAGEFLPSQSARRTLIIAVDRLNTANQVTNQLNNGTLKERRIAVDGVEYSFRVSGGPYAVGSGYVPTPGRTVIKMESDGEKRILETNYPISLEGLHAAPEGDLVEAWRRGAKRG